MSSHALADGWDQLRTPIFTSLGRDQGLLHPVVMAVAQDGEGFIWAGTQGGLSRYDGYRFKNYLHREDDPGSLPGNVIADLATDGGGRLWIATFTGEVARYDPATDQFHNYPEAAGQRPRAGIVALISDGGMGVWVGTNSGLEHIDGVSGAITRYEHQENDAASLPNNRINSLALGHDGDLWVGTYQGLARLQSGRTHFDMVPITDMQGHPVTDVCSGLTETADGQIWFATMQSQIGHVLPGDQPSGRTIINLASAALGGPMSTRLIEARPGELWVGRTASGITVLRLDDLQTHKISHDAANRVSLGDNMVRSMVKDRAGQIWAGTNLGISRTDPSTLTIDSIFASSRPEGLTDPNVLALSTDRDGRAWLGLKDQGVALLDPKLGKISMVAKAGEVLAGGVISLKSLDDGNVWMGATSAQGFYRANGTRVTREPFPTENIGSVRAILPDRGRLWLAAGPLIDYDPVSKQSRIYRHGEADSSLADDSAGTLLAADKNHLWVGTRRGLDLFSIGSGEFRHFGHRAGDTQSLPGDFVSCLLTDRRGRLWVGTLGSGLGISDGLDPEGRLIFHNLSIQDGLPNNNIGALIEDNQGRIWASTADGLVVIDPTTLAMQPLGLGDGVAIAAYWIGAADKLPDGTLLFGGGGGVTVAHPERLTEWHFMPPAVISALMVDGRELPGTSQTITLAAGQHGLSVEFAALDYSAPDKLHYRYRLEGFDRDWITTDPAHRVASYTNLPPGHYRLLLRGSNRIGAPTEPLALPVIVLPAWYQTLWARLLAGLLVLSAFFVLLQVRTAYLRRQSRRLKLLVARQTRDLVAANRRLEELAARDALTHIFNRRAFLERGERDVEQAKRSNRPISLLMIDLDHFKRVNDSYGHSVGDEVLRSVVHFIDAQMRETDLFARLGGEELVVLMPDTEPSAALAAAERLRSAVETGAHPIPDGKMPITVSIGLASAVQPESLKQLIDQADHALYRAKDGGRNQVAVFADQPSS